jgi:hypothetical protein
LRTIAIGSGITLPEFNVSTSDPLYFFLRLCYEECLVIQRAYDEGYEISQVESTDIADAEALFASLSTELTDWYDVAIAASVAGTEIPALDVSYIPELIELLMLISTGQWGLIFVLFVKVGVKFLIDYIQRKLPQDSNLDEAAQALETIFLDKDTVPGEIINRLDTIRNFIVLSTSGVVVDSTDYESMEE